MGARLHRIHVISARLARLCKRHLAEADFGDLAELNHRYHILCRHASLHLRHEEACDERFENSGVSGDVVPARLVVNVVISHRAAIIDDENRMRCDRRR